MQNIFNYKRGNSHCVKVGNVVIGGGNNIVPQSMGIVSTNDIENATLEAERIAASGAELVRYTAQGVREAENLGKIKNELTKKGIFTPIVADIHFNAEAAFSSAHLVDKVRINPGNFASKELLCERFSRLVDICNKHNTTLRIGVNHGSLSSRMVEEYGDTVEGMVASAMEYLFLARELNFDRIVVSMKSSNTQVMVRAYRELVSAMAKENMSYPLHLGVTEAGAGIQGRTRSAVGIGTLLSEGIGDTIRVSLTEKAEMEVPFAREIINYIDKAVVGDEKIDICDELASISTLNSGSFIAPIPFLIDGEDIDFVKVDFSNFTTVELEKDTVVIDESSFHRRKAILYWLRDKFSSKKVVVKLSYILQLEQFIAALGVDLGASLMDGFIDGLWIDNSEISDCECREIVLDVLQASRRRISSPEYISCPGCGRTLYDIQSVLAAVKQRTKGLKNIKLAVMGCIVNGPGEMADADYGYVGAAAGKVTLYMKGEPYKKNIPQEEALDELIALLRENNEFLEIEE